MSSFGVECIFEDCAENCGVDLVPPEAGHIINDNADDFGIKFRQLDIAVMEESAVDVRERGQVIIKIGVSVFAFCVKYPEQLNQ